MNFSLEKNLEGLNEASNQIFQINKAKGFWDNERNIGELLMLVTSELEEAMQSSRQSYRDCLIEWIVAYKENRKPNLCNKYQTPMEVAEGIWEPYLCNNEEDKLWFGSLREGLVKWINSYCNKS